GSGLIRLGRWASTPQPEVPGLAEIVAALPTPMLLVDPAGVVCEANAAAENLLNLGRQLIVDRNIEDMIGHPLTSVANDSPFVAFDLELTLPGARRQRGDVMVGPLPDRPGWRVLTIHVSTPAHLVG